MSKKILNRFEQDLQLRGLTKLTREAYLRAAVKFMGFHAGPVSRAKSRDVSDFLHHLMSEKHFTASTVNQYVAALRLLFSVTLDKSWALEKIVFAKTPKKLPDVLSGSEMLKVLKAFD